MRDEQNTFRERKTKRHLSYVPNKAFLCARRKIDNDEIFETKESNENAEITYNTK